MRVKKQIALLLSGAILAGSLAGCSRTIIEHQIHTNTEYITETGTIQFNTSVELENLLREHDLKLTEYITYKPSPDSYDDPMPKPNYDDKITIEDIKDFLNPESDNFMQLKIMKEFNQGGMDEYVSIVLQSLSEFCKGLYSMTDEQWEQFEENFKSLKENNSSVERTFVLTGGTLWTDKTNEQRYIILTLVIDSGHL